MYYQILSITVYLLSFFASFYALQAIQFEKFCNTKKPGNVQALLLLLSFALAYLVGQFILCFFV